jgi:hypothetical protein
VGYANTIGPSKQPGAAWSGCEYDTGAYSFIALTAGQWENHRFVSLPSPKASVLFERICTRIATGARASEGVRHAIWKG